MARSVSRLRATFPEAGTTLLAGSIASAISDSSVALALILMYQRKATPGDLASQVDLREQPLPEALASTISVCLSNSDQFDSFESPTIPSEFYRLPNQRQPPMEHPRPKGGPHARFESCRNFQREFVGPF